MLFVDFLIYDDSATRSAIAVIDFLVKLLPGLAGVESFSNSALLCSL